MYSLIEIFSRGFSHISMFICGGICFILIGLLNEFKSINMSLLTQMILGSLIITFFEFATGVIVNIWLKLNVWDYSSRPFNLLGQICLLFSVFWIFISLPAIFIDDFFRFKFFNEALPKYKFF